MFISCGCCNKCPRWLETKDIYHFTVLEARSKVSSTGPKSSWQGCALSPEAPGEIHSSPAASGSYWHSLACGHISPIFKVCSFTLLSAPSLHRPLRGVCVSACTVCVCMRISNLPVFLLEGHLRWHLDTSQISQGTPPDLKIPNLITSTKT